MDKSFVDIIIIHLIHINENSDFLERSLNFFLWQAFSNKEVSFLYQAASRYFGILQEINSSRNLQERLKEILKFYAN